jgi:hypothetical protein
MSCLATAQGEARFDLVHTFGERAGELFDLAAAGSDLRTVEKTVAEAVFALGREAMSSICGMRSLEATQQDIEKRGLTPGQVRLRLDSDYFATVNSTMGPFTFPLFAFREECHGATVTRTPAREAVIPYHSKCHSTPLCLEWEIRLGADHPFRRAQQELSFVTHGAVTLEDTTISAHLVAMAGLVGREWMYHGTDDIREFLRDQATRTTDTNQPIIYVSCDAHSLPRYVDDTWDAQWKMVNGIRLWCEDRQTGRTIHIGGEFTWGDCKHVGAIFRELISSGTLPADGDYGDGVQAQIVWVSDAMGWFEDHILPLFPLAVIILDISHLLRWFAVLASKVYGAGTKAAKRLYALARRILGFRPKTDKRRTPRRGHKKTRRDTKEHAHNYPAEDRFKGMSKGGDALVKALLDIVSEAADETEREDGIKEIERLGERLCNNTLRMRYPEYLSRGFQIGSGAMESMHRTGSQCRTKLPGARWLQKSSQAIFNFRMLKLVGFWEKFWGQPSLVQDIAITFGVPDSGPTAKQGQQSRG